jgi:hypothetical protein
MLDCNRLLASAFITESISIKIVLSSSTPTTNNFQQSDEGEAVKMLIMQIDVTWNNRKTQVHQKQKSDEESCQVHANVD